MPKKKTSPSAPPGNDWFLADWMRALKISQAGLSERTGWSKASMNDIYHGRTSYYRRILNEAADALHLQPYELLMHPRDAMEMRRITRSVRVITNSKALTAAADEEDVAVTG